MTGVVQSTPDAVTLAGAALAATRAVPGVAGISRGRYAIARTYGPAGRVIEGIALTPEREGLHVEVHVVVRLVPLPPLAAVVRAAIATTLQDLGAPVTAVDVWVDDLCVAAAEAEEQERL